jgi:hypothetical protein
MAAQIVNDDFLRHLDIQIFWGGNAVHGGKTSKNFCHIHGDSRDFCVLPPILARCGAAAAGSTLLT